MLTAIYRVKDDLLKPVFFFRDLDVIIRLHLEKKQLNKCLQMAQENLL